MIFKQIPVWVLYTRSVLRELSRAPEMVFQVFHWFLACKAAKRPSLSDSLLVSSPWPACSCPWGSWQGVAKWEWEAGVEKHSSWPRACFWNQQEDIQKQFSFLKKQKANSTQEQIRQKSKRFQNFSEETNFWRPRSVTCLVQERLGTRKHCVQLNSHIWEF